jgi:hypothetical protein
MQMSVTGNYGEPMFNFWVATIEQECSDKTWIEVWGLPQHSLSSFRPVQIPTALLRARLYRTCQYKQLARERGVSLLH